MEFVSPDPNATVRAANVKATLDAFKLVPSMGLKLIEKHQLNFDDMTPDNFIPVQRWLDQRRDLPADAFIETIPYRETREYVARVLAFSVIYDWRLRGEARPITSRLPDPGRPWAGPSDAAKPVVCARA